MSETFIQIGRGAGRKTLQPGQLSRLVTVHRTGAEREVVYETDTLIEAPNWTPDGKWLIVNEGGLLYRIPANGSAAPSPIATGAIATCNNDHVLSFDGQWIYFSADGHLYEIPITGGEPRRVSNLFDPPACYRYFLHGISPDGAQLAYVAVEPLGDDAMGQRYVALVPTAGGADIQLTDKRIPADGPEYSPDGEWIYFNSELAATQPGHAQLFRMRPDGSDVMQLTFDERVNWFPHLSPDGRWVIYLSYASGTQRHPADMDVLIRLMPAEGGEIREVVALFGGQGTLNVNSWSPDSERFAYVEYPPVR
jgi:Tol biopolymer transport system component